MNKRKEEHIKFKVITGYILVFAAILVSGYVAYKSYNKLLNSVYSLSNPDDEIIRMNTVLTNLSEAENNIRIYSLTRQQNHLNKYVKRVKDIENSLNSLKALHDTEPSYVTLIDSMTLLLDQRSTKLQAFVRLKKKKERDNPTRKAIEELNRAADSIIFDVKTSESIQTYLDTIETLVPTVKKKKGLFGWLSKKEVGQDTLRKVVTRTSVSIDTTYIPQSDSILSNVRAILESMQAEQARYQALLSREELKLINENSQILSKVKNILYQLEKNRLVKLRQKTEAAKEIASNSIFVISVIIIIGIVLGTLFIYFIVVDISRSNFYKSELIRAKGRAEKLAKVKEEFLSNMSHEIRTPLNAIIGFTRLLKKTELESNQELQLNIVESSSNHLLEIVNEILDLAKLEAGKISLDIHPFNPVKLQQEVHALMQLTAQQKGLTLETEFNGDAEITLDGDTFRIKQILLNLIGNAIKFTNEGFIKIATTLIEKGKDYELTIAVTDSGIGIEKDKLRDVFKDFSQADSSTSRKYGGTGLGLSISRKLALLMKGNLTAESTVGEGSTFTFNVTLPKSEHVPIGIEKGETATIPDALKDIKVLVADDDPYSLLLISNIIDSWGVSYDAVENGQQALEKLNDIKYDIVLTDIHMPELDGIELCKYICNNEQLSDIPVIAMTANVQEAQLKRYIQLGMTSCLTKPFDELMLLKVIVDAMEGSLMVNHLITGSTDDDLPSSNSEDQEMPYSLEGVKQFIGDDQEMLSELIKSFVDNARANIGILETQLKEEKKLEIGETAHKMLTSFRQFQLNSVIPHLVELESLLHKKDSDDVEMSHIEEIIALIVKNTSAVLNIMEKE
ncbi:response regulator [Puteibacter caeruleilacunae]|nr:response regulator [Puteibacter caeruleilacunae]